VTWRAEPTANGTLTLGRALASVVAIVVTIAAGELLRAQHPPASATTLLVRLGGITSIGAALGLLVGVVIVALMSLAVRWVRLDRPAPAERHAPNGGLMDRSTSHG
jgi:CBS-domain-containing membrane protein